jgi:pseudaminic acid cytidylyltransferase
VSRTICLIPARGGSVRVPFKNRRLFHGRPIIAYAIDTAYTSRLFDHVLVSTDDEEMAAVARRHGAWVTRRPLCDGSQGTQELAGEFLRSDHGTQYSHCCVLYATTPLLEWEDLVRGWQALHSAGALYSYSVHEDTGEDIGGFYWSFAQALVDGIPLAGNSHKVFIDRERCCDINTEADWQRAEAMYVALRGGSHAS